MNETPSPNYARTGGLVVFVTTARGTLPLENVTVRISGNDMDNASVVYERKTDRSGKTERVLLATPPASLSQTPGGENVYSTYNVAAEAKGYYSAEARNIPVFSGITSIQPLDMIPESAYMPDSNRPDIGVVTDEKEPNL